MIRAVALGKFKDSLEMIARSSSAFSFKALEVGFGFPAAKSEKSIFHNLCLKAVSPICLFMLWQDRPVEAGFLIPTVYENIFLVVYVHNDVAAA